ncbi:sensor histidine kinase [Caldicellulosiruptoraceae bacterium PP1]
MYKSFNRLHERLKTSLNELIITKNQEINAKFLALQSQMNPHFLFNSLANISAMAEEGMNKDIIKLCNNIAQMLRYVSDNTKNYVTLYDEIEQTNRYLECMKIRYGVNLNYIIDIPSEIYNISIPKLIIQPLVKNCIKHAFSTLPPWEIKIIGNLNDNIWTITIYDNGVGFSNQALNTIQEFMQKFNNLDSIPDLKIEGMGILNIYIRLKLIYKDNIIFNIKNNDNSGACITIGGPYQAILEEK